MSTSESPKSSTSPQTTSPQTPPPPDPIGKLGLLSLVGTGGSDPATRFLNPTAFDINNKLNWHVYHDHVTTRCDGFGTIHAMHWCPGGNDGSRYLQLDQWPLLYPDAFDRVLAGHAFNSYLTTDDVVFIGSYVSDVYMRQWATLPPSAVFEKFLAPFAGAGTIVFDHSASAHPSHPTYALASYLHSKGIRSGCEAWPYRESPWYNDLDSSVWVESQIFKKYARPSAEWADDTDRKLLVPYDEIQCPINIFVCGPHDNAGVSPTLQDVAKWLALGHNVYVAPTTSHLWRGRSAAQIRALAHTLKSTRP